MIPMQLANLSQQQTPITILLVGLLEQL